MFWEDCSYMLADIDAVSKHCLCVFSSQTDGGNGVWVNSGLSRGRFGDGLAHTRNKNDRARLSAWSALRERASERDRVDTSTAG